MTVLQTGLQRYLSPAIQARLGAVKVGIAGAGGLGSNVAMLLARTGIRKFVLADFDQVEASNLNRQFYFADQVGQNKVHALQTNLLGIDQQLQITPFQERLKAENILSVFGDCDLLIEALDRAESKKILVESWLTTGRFLVAVSGIPAPGQGRTIQARSVRPGFWLVGDSKTDTNSLFPPLAPGVLLAAAMQADIVIHHLIEGKKA